MQARNANVAAEQQQDPGGKKLSEAGRDFLVQNLRDQGVSATDLGGNPSVVKISGRVCAWVKTLQSDFSEVPLSYDKQGWKFHGDDLLVIVTNIRRGEERHPDAKIYAMSEAKAKELANGGRFISKSKLRKWIAEGRGEDEWRRFCDTARPTQPRSANVPN